MRVSDFRALLDCVSELTPPQRELLLGALQDGRSEIIRELLDERVADGIRCPHCGDPRVISWGQATGLPRWRCKGCGRTFNPFTGTALARLHYRQRWPDYAQSLRQGETLRVAAERCGVHINTAHRWRHRFLSESAASRGRLAGIAEADETLLLRSFKGQPRLREEWGRRARKRGGKATRAGRNRQHVNVLVGRDRGGVTIDRVLDTMDTRSVRTVLRRGLQPDAVLCTDGFRIYELVAKQLGLRHEALQLNHGERVRGPFHIQNVNNYHSRWKGWMHRFHGVSTQYLPNYLGWFRNLDANLQARSAKFMLQAALGH